MVGNIKNKTIFTQDNLHVMRGLNSASVDLIYLDPPFNSKANYAAPIGSIAAGATFKDMWSLDDLDEDWIEKIKKEHPRLWHAILVGYTNSNKSYLIYMAIRLLEMKRILKNTGSIYLHCDPTMSHYLKILMDAIFGNNNFRNEIVWYYGGRGAKAISRQFSRNKDVILYYTMKNGNHRFNKQSIPHKYTLEEARKKGFRKDEKGRWFKTSPRGDYTDKSIERLRKEDRVYKTKTGSIRIKYFLERDYLNNQVVIENKLVGDVWFDIPDAMHMPKKEKTGYPTQKPLPLLRRIIKASSNPGDVVFDPFCGCATTCVAAEELGRQWIGIDISPKAAELVKTRITEFQNRVFEDLIHLTDLPHRTDLGPIPPYNSPENKEKLYEKQEGFCKFCKKHFLLRNLTVDHIIAKTKGGTDLIENLQLLCGACNSTKGDRDNKRMNERIRKSLGFE